MSMNWDSIIKYILSYIIIAFLFIILFWIAFNLENNDKVKRIRRVNIINFYREQGRQEIRLEAIDLKFATMVEGKLKWNTNVSDLVERSYGAQKTAMERVKVLTGHPQELEVIGEIEKELEELEELDI